jgi:hypothetical protein
MLHNNNMDCLPLLPVEFSSGLPKGIIRAQKSKKDRQYNDEKKKDKPLSIKLYTEN